MIKKKIQFSPLKLFNRYKFSWVDSGHVCLFFYNIQWYRLFLVNTVCMLYLKLVFLVTEGTCVGLYTLYYLISFLFVSTNVLACPSALWLSLGCLICTVICSALTSRPTQWFHPHGNFALMLPALSSPFSPFQAKHEILVLANFQKTSDRKVGFTYKGSPFEYSLHT